MWFWHVSINCSEAHKPRCVVLPEGASLGYIAQGF